jgi:hypothetical protein
MLLTPGSSTPDIQPPPIKLTTSGNLAVALRYAAAGMPVFPCGQDKKPALVDSWSREATTEESTIRDWWAERPDAIVGLPMKPLDMLAIDCDVHGEGQNGVAAFRDLCEANGKLPAHPTSLTAGNGEHHFFKQPAEKIGNHQDRKSGIETRGYQQDNDGGYVIAPGSRLPDGRAWRLANSSPSVIQAYKAGTIPEVPAWLVARLAERLNKQHDDVEHHDQRPQQPSTASRREQAYAQKTLDNVAAELAAVAPGTGRNNALNTGAYTLATMAARNWIDRGAIERRLFEACEANSLIKDDGAYSVRSTLKSGIEAGLKTPHQDLADRPLHNGNGAQRIVSGVAAD